ncbi:MAG TPA: aminopeptidase P N-terminal domain-containing protein [Vicinamibacterales bacterium]|nr:aminopeptidase P N-terminal domain-containing protein [Vicinamibacterales bacterium]
MNTRARRISIAITCVLAVARLTTAGPLQDDLKARRARALERLGPDTLAIFWSAPPRVYSNDVNYEYRQDSNLLYLTGIDQEDTILVLMPGNKTRREILFVREADARREHWNGHSLTPAEASAQSGIATVLTVKEFDTVVAAALSGQGGPALGGPDDARTFLDAMEQGKAKLALLLEPQRTLNDAPGPARQFATHMRDRFFGFQVKDATPVLAELRQIKTPYEQAVLRKSALISSDAHKAGMRAAAAGKFEYEVEAAIEEVYLRNGAMSWGYPSIVGSGPNATILHYEKSSRQMHTGDLLLVDAAANYEGQTADITRTYPIDGRFTQAQRDIYEIVFAAQEAGIKAARVGNRAQDIQNACDEVLRAGLVKLGLVLEPTGTQFKIWATHGVSHWIGMDVHDVGARNKPIAPGMAFTIEPGIYVREAALNDLPKTPENAAFIEKVRAAVQKYKDVGVRIEDSFLVTDKGVENLSASVPRTLADVERFLASRGTR